MAAWQLDASREGTLDRVLVVVALDRPTLVDDQMWAARIREAVASVVPVRVETRVVGVDDVLPPPQLEKKARTAPAARARANGRLFIERPPHTG